MPSATPRNSEKVPSVTISAGNRSREISTAFNRAAGTPDGKRDGGRHWNWPLQIAPRRAETDRRQTHHGADRQVDAAGDQNRRQRHGEQPELGVQPRDLEEVGEREEVRRDEGEDRHLDGNRTRGRPFGMRPYARA